MDPLANLLDGPRGRGAFLLRTVMEPPWSVRMADDAPLGLLAVVAGSAWVVPDAGAPVHLPAGSVAVVKGPGPVTLASGPGGRRTTTGGDDLGQTMDLGVRTWGNHPDGSTVVLMGCYQLRGEISRRVLDALPGSIVLEPAAWTPPLVPLLDTDIAVDAPGQGAVLDRLYDLLLVSAIRTWFDRPGAAVPGWYRAHGDRVLGRALRLLQEDPARPWTVAGLAAETGSSRSAPARNFTDLVGIPR